MTDGNEPQWYYLLGDKQVGPVGLAEIQALIDSGTLTSATMVWRPGLSGWEQAGKTELGARFGAGSGSAARPPATITPPAAPRDDTGKIPIWRCISQGFGIIFRNPVPFILGNLFFLLMNGLSLGLLTGSWQAGMQLMTRKVRAGQPVVFSDIFQGFDRFGLVLGAGLVGQVSVTLGMAFCLIPGFIIGGQFLYLVPLVAIRGCSIAEAITLSRQKAKARLFNHVLFYFVLCLIGLSGAILCYVGLVVTLPLIPTAIALAYESTFENQGQAQP